MSMYSSTCRNKRDILYIYLNDFKVHVFKKGWELNHTLLEIGQRDIRYTIPIVRNCALLDVRDDWARIVFIHVVG